MTISPRIASVETFIVSIPRDVPYLGGLGQDEQVNSRGYLIRKGNRTIYPATDMSVLIKLTADDGTVGWGETYGIVAPEAVTAIIDDVLGPAVIGRDPRDAVVIQEDLYDMMRVRGFFGGFYVDSIAGVDIAIWDLFGKLVGQPVVKLIGGQRRSSIPAYVSGLPGRSLDERVALAHSFVARGFSAFKYHAAVSFDGIIDEMRALREGLGESVQLMVDLHWKFTAQEAIQLIDQLTPYRPCFVEAPCQPEDIEGQTQVGAQIRVPLALGEEWRTVYEYRPRLERRAMSIIQPEMGHIGISQFMQIARMANAFHMKVIPHASIGIGIFQAASLHAAAALPNVPMHEYQHSVFDRNLQYVETTMRCVDGAFQLPEGPGLGIEPSEKVWQHIRKKPTV
ncbi:mandelate racemase/muconate lactonizing enzyme family protein [Paraburkholderia metrosideri]|jgi:L-alanine-DL-glutamate epimerase-like enolase superfamily enzyme|uniref:D-galactarolactone cycloisomerase n=1 Tax=Paraburkholderia metrosideri TaxID=580937 RepID=A0ABM8NNK2_9BURK|nr:mandelate racemase/muconate lactonizing enzyme family protein [Paraburkholderia metrosideri]CAD6535249.1 D-galactarolactone cycloisomerase [Paraburkholderia metrosideri]